MWVRAPSAHCSPPRRIFPSPRASHTRLDSQPIELACSVWAGRCAPARAGLILNLCAVCMPRGAATGVQRRRR